MLLQFGSMGSVVACCADQIFSFSVKVKCIHCSQTHCFVLGSMHPLTQSLFGWVDGFSPPVAPLQRKKKLQVRDMTYSQVLSWRDNVCAANESEMVLQIS